MRILAPSYYADFVCKADKCQSSCCIGWRVGVDEESLLRFRDMTGKIGEDIRKSLACDGDGAYITLASDGRCPHLLPSGLCRIISELGQDAVPEICREHPRFYNMTEHGLEVGLGASCEAAAELIICGADYSALIEVGNAEGDAEAFQYSPTAERSEVFSLLEKSESFTAACDALIGRFAPDFCHAELSDFCECFTELEYTSEMSHRLFTSLGDTKVSRLSLELRNFLAYLVYRHVTPAENSDDFRARLAFAILGARAVEALTVSHGDTREALLEFARIFSLEIEYSEDNTDSMIFELSCRLM